MPDAIHTSLADLQSSLFATHTAESPDGSVVAEATARRQTALRLSPAALRLPPADLAALILSTQQEAQSGAEAAITSQLDGFRADPRVATALDTLRDARARPTFATPRRQETGDDHNYDDNYAVSVYNKNDTW